jgi:hypothetical protein
MEDQRYKSEMLQETKQQTRLIEKIYNNVLFFLWLTVTSIVASAIVIAIVLSKTADIDETTSVEVEAANPAAEAEVTTAPAAVEGAAEAQSVETKPGVDEEYAN